MIFIRRLVWDPSNVAHIARHGVVPEEVEEVCHGDHVQREAYKGRIMVIGLTVAQRTLAVILDPEDEEGVYYPVTARTASRKERRIYRVEKGGEEK